MDGSAGIACVADSPDGPVIKCTDPYQDARQASFRKDILNRRLALSLCGYNDPAFYGIDLDPLQLKLVTDAKQHGESYATDTPENLKLAFDRIARKIKIRRASNF